MVQRLRAASGIKPGETVEPQEWSQGKIILGEVSIEGESEALYTVQNWDEDGYDTILPTGQAICIIHIYNMY